MSVHSTWAAHLGDARPRILDRLGPNTRTRIVRVGAGAAAIALIMATAYPAAASEITSKMDEHSRATARTAAQALGEAQSVADGLNTGLHDPAQPAVKMDVIGGRVVTAALSAGEMDTATFVDPVLLKGTSKGGVLSRGAIVGVWRDGPDGTARIEPVAPDLIVQVIPDGTGDSRVENVEVNPVDGTAPGGLVVFDTLTGDLELNLDGTVRQIGEQLDGGEEVDSAR